MRLSSGLARRVFSARATLPFPCAKRAIEDHIDYIIIPPGVDADLDSDRDVGHEDLPMFAENLDTP